MGAPRSSEFRQLATALIAVAFLLRSIVPAGFMPDLRSSDGGLSFVICAPGASSALGGSGVQYSADQLAALAFLADEIGQNETEIDKPCDFGLLSLAMALGNVPQLPSDGFDISPAILSGDGDVHIAAPYSQARPRSPPVS
ncbi:hypothetical protein NUH88_17720 [Nisaea acidiphila]|uniref:Uncharacterized protein n=1 Tax=Nisaea acidiphila TaxID=1862145 RepID=A0A9J7ASB8_9PROT|nr:hypothetical protein [Nisaea acidiphila]UUX49228.1 hypothetical protein NUH88_17720 [Nisaea acidiphila]